MMSQGHYGPLFKYYYATNSRYEKFIKKAQTVLQKSTASMSLPKEEQES
jgi:hypothetical protein